MTDLLVNVAHGFARAKDVEVTCTLCWNTLPIGAGMGALLAKNVEDKLGEHIADKHPTRVSVK